MTTNGRNKEKRTELITRIMIFHRNKYICLFQIFLQLRTLFSALMIFSECVLNLYIYNFIYIWLLFFLFCLHDAKVHLRVMRQTCEPAPEPAQQPKKNCKDRVGNAFALNSFQSQSQFQFQCIADQLNWTAPHWARVQLVFVSQCCHPLFYSWGRPQWKGDAKICCSMTPYPHLCTIRRWRGQLFFENKPAPKPERLK